MSTIIPKYSVGQVVHCFRKETDEFMGFNFVGEIQTVCVLDEDQIEYSVSNAPTSIIGPILIWEQEITGIYDPDREFPRNVL